MNVFIRVSTRGEAGQPQQCLVRATYSPDFLVFNCNILLMIKLFFNSLSVAPLGHR